MNLTDKQRREIAQELISLHADNDINNWFPLTDFDHDKKLLDIYYKLTDGVFGTVDIDLSEHTAAVEISRFESKSGNPVIFNFAWEYGSNDHE